MVDEVTQYQAVGSVETISERHLLPVLEQLLAAFPFAILGFHSDNGSEYVNRRVAKLLEKLRAEFTKSRPRRSIRTCTRSTAGGGYRSVNSTRLRSTTASRAATRICDSAPMAGRS